MYKNLIKAMKAKGLSVNAMAKILDMPEPTLRGKITEGRSFSVDEAIRTKFLVFPEYDITYLFKVENPDTDNLI